jgi:hypothetical protein
MCPGNNSYDLNCRAQFATGSVPTATIGTTSIGFLKEATGSLIHSEHSGKHFHWFQIVFVSLILIFMSVILVIHFCHGCQIPAKKGSRSVTLSVPLSLPMQDPFDLSWVSKNRNSSSCPISHLVGLSVCLFQFLLQ